MKLIAAMIENKQPVEKLSGIWVCWISLIIILISVTVFYDFTGDQYRLNISETPPEFLRTILYAITIITFPLSNVLRHIMNRLNQTMPDAGSAKLRYTKTCLSLMLIACSIACYGVYLYLFGDTINTLYIFSSLSALAFWLYRPKQEEYEQIYFVMNSSTED